MQSILTLTPRTNNSDKNVKLNTVIGLQKTQQFRFNEVNMTNDSFNIYTNTAIDSFYTLLVSFFFSSDQNNYFSTRYFLPFIIPVVERTAAVERIAAVVRIPAFERITLTAIPGVPR